MLHIIDVLLDILAPFVWIAWCINWAVSGNAPPEVIMIMLFLVAILRSLDKAFKRLEEFKCTR